MKFTKTVFWLFLASALFTAEARAGLVLDPEAGLSRVTSYGRSVYAPPGITGVTYTANTNGVLYGDVEPRSSVGSNTDTMLLYNLQGLGGVAPSQAMLAFQIDSVYCNGSSGNSPPLGAWVSVLIAGTNDGTLGAANYLAAFITPSTGFGIGAGLYKGSVTLDVDISAMIAKLVGQGFSYATVFLQTSETTTGGPNLVDFTQAPELDVTQSLPNSGSSSSAIPEASSIVHLGVSVLGLMLYKSARRLQSLRPGRFSRG